MTKPQTTTAEGWVLVPREPTRDWIHNLANSRQGKSLIPRSETPSEYELALCKELILEALAAAPPPPPSAQSLERDGGGGVEVGPYQEEEGWDWRVAWLVRQAKDDRLTPEERLSIIANFPTAAPPHPTPSELIERLNKLADELEGEAAEAETHEISLDKGYDTGAADALRDAARRVRSVGGGE